MKDTTATQTNASVRGNGNMGKMIVEASYGGHTAQRTTGHEYKFAVFARLSFSKMDGDIQSAMRGVDYIESDEAKANYTADGLSAAIARAKSRLEAAVQRKVRDGFYCQSWHHDERLAAKGRDYLAKFGARDMAIVPVWVVREIKSKVRAAIVPIVGETVMIMTPFNCEAVVLAEAVGDRVRVLPRNDKSFDCQVAYLRRPNRTEAAAIAERRARLAPFVGVRTFEVTVPKAVR